MSNLNTCPSVDLTILLEESKYANNIRVTIYLFMSESEGQGLRRVIKLK